MCRMYNIQYRLMLHSLKTTKTTNGKAYNAPANIGCWEGRYLGYERPVNKFNKLILSERRLKDTNSWQINNPCSYCGTKSRIPWTYRYLFMNRFVCFPSTLIIEGHTSSGETFYISTNIIVVIILSLTSAGAALVFNCYQC